MVEAKKVDGIELKGQSKAPEQADSNPVSLNCSVVPIRNRLGQQFAICGGIKEAARALDVDPVLIRLAPRPTRCSGSSLFGVKLGVGERGDITRNAEQGAEGVKGQSWTRAHPNQCYEHCLYCIAWFPRTGPASKLASANTASEVLAAARE